MRLHAMRVTKTLLLAGASVALISASALAASDNPPPPPDTARQSTDAVAQAEANVEAARAALRAAMAAGEGIEAAKAKLSTALQALADARSKAGLPPLPANGEGAGQRGKNPPQPQTAAPATETPAPATSQTAPETQAAPETMQPAPETAQPAPATEEGAPRGKNRKPGGPADNGTPQTQEQSAPATATPPQGSAQPPAIPLPPPPAVTPPPPPPPAATQGTFDFKKFRDRPKFGALPPGAPVAQPNLPKSEDAVKEGSVIQAPDGRVIVKENGQVNVIHDDAGRFLQQGGRVNSARAPNGNTTTTVTRPDGSAIVTVRDAGGDILQRYRKKPDGSIEMIIGSAPQTGILDKVLGRGNQPPPPPPPPPPAAELKFGPLRVTIPQQQYIVESSRATPQQLEQALIAPPVERIERPYSLEEVRRNGRLRDKVRRIDFDTITFDTGQATVPDDQVPTMQSIGTAIRDIVRRDPRTVILIEGHTDAVGSDLANLALSDRRAETVAEILSYYFGVPPENLVTQGYGEQYLKIPTVGAERENRRVAFRNITNLLRGSQ
jgi:outer membrane protein OmpA-like peptidoglycan-associated protein